MRPLDYVLIAIIALLVILSGIFSMSDMVYGVVNQLRLKKDVENKLTNSIIHVEYFDQLFLDMYYNQIQNHLTAGAYYFLKGIYYGPKGGRLISGVKMVREKAPVFGGNFASWAFCQSISVFIIANIRRKEDYKNNLLGTLATGTILSIRSWKEKKIKLKKMKNSVVQL